MERPMIALDPVYVERFIPAEKPLHTTHHTFALRQRVRIIDLDVVATVRNIQLSVDGTGYKVSFYIDSKRNDEWVYEDEIEAVKS